MIRYIDTMIVVWPAQEKKRFARCQERQTMAGKLPWNIKPAGFMAKSTESPLQKD